MSTEIINKNGKSYAVIPYETYQQFKVYREYRNLTQLELANRANLSINKIQQIEADIDFAKKEELEAIVKILNINLDMIL